MRDMKKGKVEILKEHTKVIKTILGNGRSTDELESDLFDWMTFEKGRFAPLAK